MQNKKLTYWKLSLAQQSSESEPGKSLKKPNLQQKLFFRPNEGLKMSEM